MKQFLKNFLGIVVILLFVSIAIEVCLLFVPNVYSYKKTYVEDHINDIECLLLGNSHIEEALDPSEMMPGTFNLAISGRLFIYDVELAKKYVPQMPNLKTLIVPLEYTKFSFDRDIKYNSVKDNNGKEDTYKCMYYKYMGIRIEPFWYWSEILYSKLNYMARFFISKKDAIECDSLGFVPLKLITRVPGWEFRNLPDSIDTSKHINRKKYQILYDQYKEIANVTEKNKVRLVLLSPPMYKTGQSHLPKDVAKEISLFINDLKKDGCNIEYYDYTYDNRFIDDDFNDASHLNENGAKKFSKIVRSDILGS